MTQSITAFKMKKPYILNQTPLMENRNCFQNKLPRSLDVDKYFNSLRDPPEWFVDFTSHTRIHFTQ